MDSLSSVLRAVRLTGVVFFEVQASDPWVAETPSGASIVSSIFPGSQNLIPYHAVTYGSCWAWALDEPPVHLSAGDIVVSRTATRTWSPAHPGCAAFQT